MRVIILLLAPLLFYSPLALSMVYSGVVTTTQKKVRIKETRLQRSFDLTFSSPEIESLIRQLAVNDHVSFEGIRSSDSNIIRVNSVHYVGLINLVATWRGDDNYCYSFTSFTELKIYTSKKSRCNFTPSLSRRYAYTINPGQPGWMILLSDNSANYVADLAIKNSRLAEISLYDLNTGDILRVIKLRK